MSPGGSGYFTCKCTLFRSMFKIENTMAVDLRAPRMHPLVLYLFPQENYCFHTIKISDGIARITFACTVCCWSISCTVGRTQKFYYE